MGKIIILIFFLISNVNAQEIIEHIRLKGSIGKSKISMYLTIKNDVVSGYYSYNKYKSNIYLQGEIKADALVLVEYIDGKKNGSINAFFNRDKGYVGTWSNGDKNVEFFAERQGYSYKDFIKEIKVINIDPDKNGNEFLIKVELTYTDNKTQILSLSSIEETVLIYIEDMNFDGYPDIRYLTNSGVNESYSYFIYSPEQKKFLHSELLTSLIVSPKILYDQELIIGISRDGCCYYSITYLKNNGYDIYNYDYTKKEGKKYSYDLTGKIKSQKNISRNDFEKYFEL